MFNPCGHCSAGIKYTALWSIELKRLKMMFHHMEKSPLSYKEYQPIFIIQNIKDS